MSNRESSFGITFSSFCNTSSDMRALSHVNINILVSLYLCLWKNSQLINIHILSALHCQPDLRRTWSICAQLRHTCPGSQPGFVADDLARIRDNTKKVLRFSYNSFMTCFCFSVPHTHTRLHRVPFFGKGNNSRTKNSPT